VQKIAGEVRLWMETNGHGSVLSRDRRPPLASAQDEDIYLTVSVAAPALDSVETIDMFLSIDFAHRILAELGEAVDVAMKNAV
jgi:hypothetical protein